MKLARLAVAAFGLVSACGDGDTLCDPEQRHTSFPFRVRVVEAASGGIVCEQQTSVWARSIDTGNDLALVAVEENSTSTSTNTVCVYLPPSGLVEPGTTYEVDAENPRYRSTGSKRVAPTLTECGWKLMDVIVFFAPIE